MDGFLDYQGRSTHFPKLNELVDSMYNLMMSLHCSGQILTRFYQYCLELSAFTSEFMQSEYFFVASRKIAPDVLQASSISVLLSRYPNLHVDQVFMISRNIIFRYYQTKHVNILSEQMFKALKDRTMKMVFYPYAEEFKFNQFIDFQLNFTLTYCLLNLFLFLNDCVLESFDIFRNVDFRYFKLKQLVYRSQDAPDVVDFWFPAYSFDGKCIFQARWIPAKVSLQGDLDSQLNFTERAVRDVSNFQANVARDDVDVDESSEEYRNQMDQISNKDLIDLQSSQQRQETAIKTERQYQTINNANNNGNRVPLTMKVNELGITGTNQSQTYQQVRQEIFQQMKLFQGEHEQETLSLKSEVAIIKEQNRILTDNYVKLQRDFEKMFHVLQEVNSTLIEVSKRK